MIVMVGVGVLSLDSPPRLTASGRASPTDPVRFATLDVVRSAGAVGSSLSTWTAGGIAPAAIEGSVRMEWNPPETPKPGAPLAVLMVHVSPPKTVCAVVAALGEGGAGGREKREGVRREVPRDPRR